MRVKRNTRILTVRLPEHTFAKLDTQGTKNKSEIIRRLIDNKLTERTKTA